jgi:glycine/D-amino acid oxidase-like deaminating enzyme
MDPNVQVAVIGAGYTGLSAALHLAQAGRAVAVLESGDVGEGASGLNGGQVIPGVKHDPDKLEELFGRAAGQSLIETVASGPSVVFELIERLGIACDVRRSGWIQPAGSEAALAVQVSRVEQWRRRGAAVELLSRAEVQRLTGSSRYCGGLIDRRGGSVQPLAYARGLAQALLRQGGQLYNHSPALKFSRAGQGYRIESPGGSRRAARHRRRQRLQRCVDRSTAPSVVPCPPFRSPPRLSLPCARVSCPRSGGVGHLQVAALLSPR